MPVRYEIALSEPAAHLVDVAVTLSGVADLDPLELTMAAWSPGSYLIRDYARYVRDVRADGAAGVRKIDKHTWLVDAGGADAVTVRYRVYGRDLTVRTNHIDDTHAFLHGPATYLFCPALASESCAVTVAPPPGWRLHTGLAGEGTERSAADVDELLDCPLHLGPREAITFEAAGKPAELLLWGQPLPGVATLDDLVADVTAVMNTHADRFGGAPYDRYLFILMLAPDAYGGLEHRNSSANLNVPFAFATRKSYESLVELLSHEYFHVWNGKRIRPAALGPFDYRREAYTRSLWVQEGITSYIDRYTLVRAGVQKPEAYLERLAEEWGKLQTIPGRARHSIEDASFDAWIKLYKPDESNINTTVSYYLKGGFVAMALDHAIRAAGAGKTIDDCLRRLWDRYGDSPRGYEDDAVQRELEAGAGLELGEFFDRYVRGTDDPDLAELLAGAGLSLEGKWDPEPAQGRAPIWLGVVIRSGRDVAAVLDGGPGAAAGRAPGDEIIALDGYRVNDAGEIRQRLAAGQPGQTAEVAVFRRGRLHTVAVELGEAPPNRFAIATVGDPTPEQRQRFEAWLCAPYPDDGLEVAATVSLAC